MLLSYSEHLFLFTLDYFSLFRAIYTYITMGNCTAKPESLRHLEIILQDWFTDISHLRGYLKDYIILYAKQPEKLQQRDPLFVKNIVELFIRVDQFANILRRFAVELLPPNSVNRQLIQDQIDQVPKLQQENSKLTAEKNYLFKENSNINNNIRKKEEEKEDLQRENNKLHGRIQDLIVENQTLKCSLDGESERHVNMQDEYEAKIKKLEQQLLEQRVEFEKQYRTHLMDAQAYQYQIKILQKQVSNGEKQHQEDEEKETLKNPTENIEFNINIHSPEDTGKAFNEEEQDVASARPNSEPMDVETTFTAARPELVETTFDRSNLEADLTDPYVIESLAKIDNIRSDAESFKRKVDYFTGTKDDQAYLHLREMLLRNIVKLDNVETEGHLVIRETKREVLRFLRKILNDLKEKAN